MALQTKTITKLASRKHHTFHLHVIEESTSVTGNTSSITWRLVLEPKVTGYKWNYASTAPVKYTIKINGKSYTGNIMKYDGKSSVIVRSGTISVPHNTDGTKSISYSFSITSISQTYLPGSASGTGSMTLTRIPRKATVTSAPDFNDEENPTITYDASNITDEVTSLMACISLTGAKDDIAYRDIPRDGSSYTFELTEEERDILRNASPNSNTLTVRFYVRTMVGDVRFLHYVAKTMTIANPNPKLISSSQSYASSYRDLTGEYRTAIRYITDITCTILEMEAVKGASIVGTEVGWVREDGIRVYHKDTTHTAYNVDVGRFMIKIIDSRGNVTTEYKSGYDRLVEYVLPTCKITKTSVPNALGEVTMTVAGDYFNGNFGAVDNELVLQYRLKIGEGEWGEYITVNADNIQLNDNNTYTANVFVTGLDYKKKNVLEFRATDKITSATSNTKTIKMETVFDWSDVDFNHNTDVTFREHAILDNAKYVRARTNDEMDTEYSVLGINSEDNLLIGFGMYDAEVGNTVLCGNELELRTKGEGINTNVPIRQFAWTSRASSNINLSTDYVQIAYSYKTNDTSDNLFGISSTGGIICRRSGSVLVMASAYCSELTAGDVVSIRLSKGVTLYGSARASATKTTVSAFIPPRIVTVSEGEELEVKIANLNASRGVMTAGTGVYITLMYLT